MQGVISLCMHYHRGNCMSTKIIIGDKKEEIRKALEELDGDKTDQDTEDKPPPSPFKINVSKPKQDDTYTSIKQIRDAYDQFFVVTVEHEHRTFKFLCERLPYFELVADRSDEDRYTMQMAYEDALNVMSKCIVPPEGEEPITYDDVALLPILLVTRTTNAILNEISPGFGFNTNVDDEEADEETDVMELEEADE